MIKNTTNIKQKAVKKKTRQGSSHNTILKAGQKKYRGQGS